MLHPRQRLLVHLVRDHHAVAKNDLALGVFGDIAFMGDQNNGNPLLAIQLLK
jgi:hypothetical protein